MPFGNKTNPPFNMNPSIRGLCALTALALTPAAVYAHGAELAALAPMLLVWFLVVASCTYFAELGKKLLALAAGLFLFPVTVQMATSLSFLFVKNDRTLPLYMGSILATLMWAWLVVRLARSAMRRERS
jgi:hypothetical protein